MGPNSVAVCIHMQAVSDEEVFGFAVLVEHGRDNVEVVQVGAPRETIADDIVHLRLKRKFSEP